MSKPSTAAKAPASVFSLEGVPALLAIGGQFDLPAILGAEIVGGCVAILFGIFVKQIRRLFPPLITGTVIFTIGLSLYPTAVKYMTGGAGSAEFGGLKNWAVALVTLAAVVALQNFGKGVLKLGAILWGMIVGYVMALCLGITQVAGSLQGPGFPAWVHTVFGSSPIVVTAIVAILLNLLLPKDGAAKPGK